MKPFNRKLKLWGNLLSIWSFSVAFIVATSTSFVIFTKKPILNDKEIKTFVILSHYLVHFNVCVLLGSSILFQTAEKTFWMVFDRLELMFKHEFKMPLRMNEFGLQNWSKMFLEIFVFYFSTFLFLTTFNAKPFGLKSIITIVVLSVIRFFGIKFVLFVDVLNFCLNNIEAKLVKKRAIALNELMCLKKALTLCWKMSRLINDIFSCGLLVTSPLLVIGVLYSVHNLSVDISNYRFNFNPLFVTISLSFQTFMMTSSSQKSLSYFSTIASLLMEKSSKEKRSTVESFAFQLNHQKITFSCKNVFQLNHKFMISVSAILSIYILIFLAD